jgi:hypothetical protein
MEFKKIGLNVVQYAERLTRGDIQREILAKSNDAIPDSSRRCSKSKNSKDTHVYKCYVKFTQFFIP